MTVLRTDQGIQTHYYATDRSRYDTDTSLCYGQIQVCYRHITVLRTDQGMIQTHHYATDRSKYVIDTSLQRTDQGIIQTHHYVTDRSKYVTDTSLCYGQIKVCYRHITVLRTDQSMLLTIYHRWFPVSVHCN